MVFGSFRPDAEGVRGFVLVFWKPSGVSTRLSVRRVWVVLGLVNTLRCVGSSVQCPCSVSDDSFRGLVLIKQDHGSALIGREPCILV